MIKLSSFYYQRWQMDSDSLIASDEELKEIVRGRINPRVAQPKGWTASYYSAILPIFFSIGWIIVLLDSVSLVNLY